MTRSSLWAAMPAFADHGAEKERLEKVLEGWLLNQGIPQVTVMYLLYSLFTLESFCWTHTYLNEFKIFFECGIEKSSEL